jgi:hypothetical protein
VTSYYGSEEKKEENSLFGITVITCKKKKKKKNNTHSEKFQTKLETKAKSTCLAHIWSGLAHTLCSGVNKRLIREYRWGNPEKLATLGTPDTGWRQTKHKYTTQKTEKDEQHKPNIGWIQALAKGKLFLPLIRHPASYYSYIEDVLNTIIFKH